MAHILPLVSQIFPLKLSNQQGIRLVVDMFFSGLLSHVEGLRFAVDFLLGWTIPAAPTGLA
jgi:hypothetical protein